MLKKVESTHRLFKTTRKTTTSPNSSGLPTKKLKTKKTSQNTPTFGVFFFDILRSGHFFFFGRGETFPFPASRHLSVGLPGDLGSSDFCEILGEAPNQPYADDAFFAGAMAGEVTGGLKRIGESDWAGCFFEKCTWKT